MEDVTVCGLSFRILRRRSDFFKAVAGDLPVSSTGLVLWECGLLLAEYLGYACFTEVPEGVRGWWQLHEPAPVVPTRCLEWKSEWCSGAARFWRSQLPVLELGGGAGLVCAALASLGASVVYTDLDLAALRTAEQNCLEAERRQRRQQRRRQRQRQRWEDKWRGPLGRWGGAQVGQLCLPDAGLRRRGGGGAGGEGAGAVRPRGGLRPALWREGAAGSTARHAGDAPCGSRGALLGDLGHQEPMLQ